MVVVCAWCKKLMRWDGEFDVMSHGICGDCQEREVAAFKGQAQPEVNLPEVAETLWGPMVVGGEG